MTDDYDYSVLFVCMGNICRSPSAEGVMRKHVAELAGDLSVLIDSAGTHAYHSGEAPDARAVAAALRRGIDISQQVARRVMPEDFERFDIVLAMDEDNLALLQEIRPPDSKARLELMLTFSQSGSDASVPDPYYGGSNGFEKVLDMLEDACAGLTEQLRQR